MIVIVIVSCKGETADSTAIESLRIPGIRQNPPESPESLGIPRNPSESLRISQNLWNPSESLGIPPDRFFKFIAKAKVITGNNQKLCRDTTEQNFLVVSLASQSQADDRERLFTKALVLVICSWNS